MFAQYCLSNLINRIKPLTCSNELTLFISPIPQNRREPPAPHPLPFEGLPRHGPHRRRDQKPDRPSEARPDQKPDAHGFDVHSSIPLNRILSNAQLPTSFSLPNLISVSSVVVLPPDAPKGVSTFIALQGAHFQTQHFQSSLF